MRGRSARGFKLYPLRWVTTILCCSDSGNVQWSAPSQQPASGAPVPYYAQTPPNPAQSAPQDTKPANAAPPTQPSAASEHTRPFYLSIVSVVGISTVLTSICACRKQHAQGCGNNKASSTAPVDCWYVYAHNDDVGSRNLKFSTPANVGKATKVLLSAASAPNVDCKGAASSRPHAEKLWSCLLRHCAPGPGPGSNGDDHPGSARARPPAPAAEGVPCWPSAPPAAPTAPSPRHAGVRTRLAVPASFSICCCLEVE
jgi:hypothetical protein